MLVEFDLAGRSDNPNVDIRFSLDIGIDEPVGSLPVTDFATLVQFVHG
jgi:hypothetical protein